MTTDKVNCVISPTGLITFYLSHNQVRLQSFKTIGAAQNWLLRRPAKVVKTTWSGLDV